MDLRDVSEVDLAKFVDLSNMLGKEGGEVKNSRVVVMPFLRLGKRSDYN